MISRLEKEVGVKGVKVRELAITKTPGKTCSSGTISSVAANVCAQRRFASTFSSAEMSLPLTMTETQIHL